MSKPAPESTGASDQGAPAGATPLEIARSSPNAPVMRLAGEPLLKPGVLVGDRYHVEEVLGRGGFGDVYRAIHVGTREQVALKVLRPDLLAEAKAVERFTAEARHSAGLKSPNTVRVFDFGQTPDGALYLAMEFLDGESLESILQRVGPLPATRSVRLVAQVLKSLAEAHGKKIVHRDLKPENIFVGELAGEPDFVRVIDFGIAKFLAEGASSVVTQAGAILGTPHYMSPEQVRGDTLDSRADLYSVGVVLYRCLSGRHPFHGDTTFGILAAHLQDPLLPVNMPGVDQDLEAIVAKSLARERAVRFANADAFRTALETWLAHQPTQAAAASNDKTQLSMDVIVPDRIRQLHEHKLPPSAETVVAGLDINLPMPPHHPVPPTSATSPTSLTIGQPTAVTAPVGASAPPSDTALISLPTPAPRAPQRRPEAPPRSSVAGDSQRAKAPGSAATRPAGRPSGRTPAASVGPTDRSEADTRAMDVVSLGPQTAVFASYAPPSGAAAQAAAEPRPEVDAPRPTRPLWPVIAGLLVILLVGGAALAWLMRAQQGPAVAIDGAAPAVAPVAGAQGRAAPAGLAAATAADNAAVLAPAVTATAAPLPSAPTPAASAVAQLPAAASPSAALVAPGAAPAGPAHAHPSPHLAKLAGIAKPAKVDGAPTAKPEKVAEKQPNHAAKSCSSAEGSKEWCASCPASQDLSPGSKWFCPCLVSRGQTAGLTYYCKCVFPKEDHKIGSPAFCRCNPRDPSCQHE